MNKKKRCPYCGTSLNPKNIVDKKMFGSRRYKITYRCPRCGKNVTVTVDRIWSKEKLGDTTYIITTKAIPEKAEIHIHRFPKKEAKKRRGAPEYMEHNIIARNGAIEHIGIHGIKEWNRGKIQFKNEKGEELEFTEREYGKTTRRWKKVRKS